MNKLMKNPIALIVGGIGAGYLITRLYKWVKHESAEMKKEAATQSMEEGSSSMSGYNNYVDEGFMGFTASDEFFMLGGGAPIEFANANGHNVPVNTDEPNFYNANGKVPNLGGGVSGGTKGQGQSTPPIMPKGHKWKKPRVEKPMKGVMDFETGEYTKFNEPRSKNPKRK
jgi:hypothetical protein